ncbi:MAG: GDP-mannose 4,6-dehydratase [Candidatus Helarchaeota archaeon]|nr:GDP-mannose 4,6-dehydratase [Candidatus Helarchaeota archaeon]
MDKDFWTGKRVLVTGADGFIGSHLTEKLLEYGAVVTIFVRGNSVTGTTQFALRNTKSLEGKIKKIITGNISARDSISLIIREEPEYILHLAADAYVPNSFEHPIEVMETNLIGTLNILEAVMNLKDIVQCVCTSSSEIYGTAQYAPIDEEHPLNGTSPYAASKIAADRYCFAYWNTYGIPVSIIRPFNTFGPRHTYDVIPKFINLALEGKALTVYGTGEQSRDFTYVSDMIRAFLIMGGNKKAIGKAINFGTGIDVSINDIAEKIVKYVAELSNIKTEVVHIEKRLAEVQRLICDYSKAKELFGWEPKVSIDEGLKKNIEWEVNRRKK